MRRLLFSALFCTALCGCQSLRTQAEEKAAAAARWAATRADVKARLASAELAAGRADSAAAELSEAKSLAPGNTRLRPLEARILLAQGDSNAAERVLRSTDPETGAPGEVEYLLGVVAQQRQQWAPALAHFEAALAAAPDDSAYLAAVVQANVQLQDAEAGLRVLDAARPRLGRTAAFHAAAAECYEQLQRWEEAAGAWRRVLASGDDPGVSERLALVLYRAGDWVAAQSALEAALERDSAGALNVRLALAECALELRDRERARDELTFVLREAPRNVRALQLLARCCAADGDYARAAAIAAQAVAADPGESVELLELAAALAQRAGQAEAARALATRIARRDPGGRSAVARAILEQ